MSIPELLRHGGVGFVVIASVFDRIVQSREIIHFEFYLCSAACVGDTVPHDFGCGPP